VQRLAAREDQHELPLFKGIQLRAFTGTPPSCGHGLNGLGCERGEITIADEPVLVVGILGTAGVRSFDLARLVACVEGSPQKASRSNGGSEREAQTHRP
jgi:hypothetical protein